MVDFSERPLRYLLQHGVVLFVILLVGFLLAGATSLALDTATLPDRLGLLHSLPRLLELTALLVGVLYAVKMGAQ